MTREEAAEVLKHLWDRFSEYDKYMWPEEKVEALTAIAALRRPEPDPDTGLMPCGCGRAMRVECYPGNHGLADAYQVTCYDCNVGTIPMRSAGKAQVAWNRAMGYKEQ